MKENNIIYALTINKFNYIIYIENNQMKYKEIIIENGQKVFKDPIENFELKNNQGKTLTYLNSQIFMTSLINNINDNVQKRMYNSISEIKEYLNNARNLLTQDTKFKILLKGKHLPSLTEETFKKNTEELKSYLKQFEINNIYNIKKNKETSTDVLVFTDPLQKVQPQNNKQDTEISKELFDYNSEMVAQQEDAPQEIIKDEFLPEDIPNVPISESSLPQETNTLIIDEIIQNSSSNNEDNENNVSSESSDNIMNELKEEKEKQEIAAIPTFDDIFTQSNSKDIIDEIEVKQPSLIEEEQISPSEQPIMPIPQISALDTQETIKSENIIENTDLEKEENISEEIKEEPLLEMAPKEEEIRVNSINDIIKEKKKIVEKPIEETSEFDNFFYIDSQAPQSEERKNVYDEFEENKTNNKPQLEGIMASQLENIPTKEELNEKKNTAEPKIEFDSKLLTNIILCVMGLAITIVIGIYVFIR